MRDFTNGRTPEQTIKESEEQEPKSGYPPREMLHVRDLNGDERGRYEHDCGDSKARC